MVFSIVKEDNINTTGNEAGRMWAWQVKKSRVPPAPPPTSTDNAVICLYSDWSMKTKH